MARWVTTIAITVTMVAAAQPAAADAPEKSPWTINIGGKGGAMLTGATEVTEADAPSGLYDDNGNWRQGSDPELYGMFGVGPGGGPTLDVRYATLVGLEASVYFTNDRAEGTNQVNNPQGKYLGEITQTQESSAIHVPVLVKAAPPFEYVRPVFGLGVEFVFQNDSSLEYQSDDFTGRVRELEQHNDIEAVSYTMLQFTGGVEFDAGPIRIPVELRVGYNLAWDDSYEGRVERDSNKQIYQGHYLGHIGAYAGILYSWDIPK